MEQLSTFSGYLLYALFPILGALVLVYIVFGIYTYRTKGHLRSEPATKVVRKKRPKQFGHRKHHRK